MDQSVLLVSAGYDHCIRFWNVRDGTSCRTIAHSDSQVNTMAIKSDKSHLAAGGYQHIRLYDVMSNNTQPLCNVESNNGAAPMKNVTSVCFDEANRWMFSASEDSTARVWDLRMESGVSCVRVFQLTASVNSVCLHPNQVELFIADQSGKLFQWDLRNDNNTSLPTEPAPSWQEASLLHVDVDPTGKMLAATTNTGFCYLYALCDRNLPPIIIPVPEVEVPHPELNNGMPMNMNSGYPYLPSSLDPLDGMPAQLDPSSMVSVEHGLTHIPECGEGDHQMGALPHPHHDLPPPQPPVPEVQSMNSFKPDRSIQAHNQYALKCRFSPDSKWLATTSGGDQCVRLFPISTFQRSECKELVVEENRLNKKWVWDCAFSKDSTKLFTCSSDSHLRLWDLDKSELIQTFKGHRSAVNVMAFADS